MQIFSRYIIRPDIYSEESDPGGATQFSRRARVYGTNINQVSTVI